MREQKGTTLLEILLALTIGTLLLAGITRFIPSMIRGQKTLSERSESIETLQYITTALDSIFTEIMLSPCGKVGETTIIKKGNTHGIHQAKLGREKDSYNQSIPILVKDSNSSEAVVPFIIPGIADHPNEPTDTRGIPFSQKFGSIVENSPYVLVMQSSRPVPVKRPRGTGNTQAIPQLITNCDDSDIFILDNNEPLLFSQTYKPNESMVYPLNLYAYYLSQVGSRTTRTFSRMNLSRWTETYKPVSQPLVRGIKDISFTWQLKNRQQQSYALVSTQNLLDSMLSTDDFQRSVVGVSIDITTHSLSNKRPQSAHNQRARRTYTFIDAVKQ